MSIDKTALHKMSERLAQAWQDGNKELVSETINKQLGVGTRHRFRIAVYKELPIDQREDFVNVVGASHA